MILLRSAAILFSVALSRPLSAQSVTVTEITPSTLVFASKTGNVVASVGPDGALLIGTPSADSTAQITEILAAKTKSNFRYLIVFPEPVAESQGDAGWSKQGAFVAMHEKALDRLGGHAMGSSKALPAHLTELKVDRPRVSFSEVITFDLNGESVHVIHQPPGYSDADAVVHFHTAHLIYLGEVFPGDGYPAVDPEQGGKLDGILNTLKPWTSASFHVVPARGTVVSGAEVKEFRDMIITARDRVKAMLDAGKTEQQIVAEHPTAEFDAKWGNGRVKPDAFVHELCIALKP